MSTITTENKKSNWKKKLALLLAFLVVIGAAIGGTVWFMNKDKNKPIQPIPGASAPELTKGIILKVPKGSQQVSQYKEGIHPSNVGELKPTPIKGSEDIFKIEIDGPCPIKKDGHIDAPADWTKGCYYQDKRGGLAFLGHSVRGPVVGAFELINTLKPGQQVIVGEKKYKVVRAGSFPNDKLPNYLWQKGRVSLITCTDSADMEAKGKWTHDTVVSLTDAT